MANSLLQLKEDFLVEIAVSKTQSHNTVQSYAQDLEQFFRFLPKMPAASGLTIWLRQILSPNISGVSPHTWAGRAIRVLPYPGNCPP